MVGVKHLPACGELWPVAYCQHVGQTHGPSHRCVLDDGHAGGHGAQVHICACGYLTAISAVMESADES